jgi:hypothetical protein
VAPIAVLYSGSGEFASIGLRTMQTARLWRQQLQPHLERAGGVGDTDIVPQLLECDVRSDPTQAVACLEQLLSTHNLSCIMAPESRLAAVVAPLADAAGVPMIASVSGLNSLYLCDERRLPPCRRSSGRRFQYVVANGVTATDVVLGLLSLLHFYSASTVAVISGSDAYNGELAQSLIRDARTNRYELLLNATIPFDTMVNSGAYSDSTYHASLEIVHRLKSVDPDVVAWINRPFCKETIDAFWDAQYYPRALVTTQCVDSQYAATEEGRLRLQYVMGINTWSPKVTGGDYSDDSTADYANRFPPLVAVHSTISSADSFAAAYQNATGEPATGTQAGVYAGFYVIEAAIAESNATDSRTLMQAVLGVNIRSFKGVLQADSNHMIRHGGGIFMQISAAGVNELVYPSSTWTAALIYPAPRFSERFYTSKPFNTPIEWIVLVLSVAWSAVVLFYLFAIVQLRHFSPVRALHWPLACLSLCGVVISNLALLTWTVHNVESQCGVRLWSWTLGSTLMFSPLVIVLLRISMLMRNTSMRGAVAARGMAGVTLLMVGQTLQLAVCVSIVLAWHLVAPFHLTTFVTDPLRPASNTMDCTSSGWLPFGVLLAVLLLLLLLLLAAASWSIRRARDNNGRFDRFRTVLSASFCWVTLLAVVGFLQATASTSVSPGFMFGMRSVLLLLANLVYVMLLFVPPIHEAMYLRKQQEKKQPRPCSLPQSLHVFDLPLEGRVTPPVAVGSILSANHMHTAQAAEPFEQSEALTATSALVILHVSHPNRSPLSSPSHIRHSCTVEMDPPVTRMTESFEMDPPVTRITESRC